VTNTVANHLCRFIALPSASGLMSTPMASRPSASASTSVVSSLGVASYAQSEPEEQRSTRNAVYQLAALTIGARLAVADA
jgi:hypothetical protein